MCRNRGAAPAVLACFCLLLICCMEAGCVGNQCGMSSLALAEDEGFALKGRRDAVDKSQILYKPETKQDDAYPVECMDSLLPSDNLAKLPTLAKLGILQRLLEHGELEHADQRPDVEKLPPNAPNPGELHIETTHEVSIKQKVNKKSSDVEDHQLAGKITIRSRSFSESNLLDIAVAGYDENLYSKSRDKDDYRNRFIHAYSLHTGLQNILPGGSKIGTDTYRDVPPDESSSSGSDTDDYDSDNYASTVAAFDSCDEEVACLTERMVLGPNSHMQSSEGKEGDAPHLHYDGKNSRLATAYKSKEVKDERRKRSISDGVSQSDEVEGEATKRRRAE